MCPFDRPSCNAHAPQGRLLDHSASTSTPVRANAATPPSGGVKFIFSERDARLRGDGHLRETRHGRRSRACAAEGVAINDCGGGEADAGSQDDIVTRRTSRKRLLASTPVDDVRSRRSRRGLPTEGEQPVKLTVRVRPQRRHAEGAAETAPGDDDDFSEDDDEWIEDVASENRLRRHGRKTVQHRSKGSPLLTRRTSRRRPAGGEVSVEEAEETTSSGETEEASDGSDGGQWDRGRNRRSGGSLLVKLPARRSGRSRGTVSDDDLAAAIAASLTDSEPRRGSRNRMGRQARRQIHDGGGKSDASEEEDESESDVERRRRHRRASKRSRR